MPSGSVTPAGGAAFNGGTITQALEIDAPTGVDVLTLTTPDGGVGTGLIRATGLHTTFYVSSDGTASFQSDDQMDLVVGGGLTPGGITVSGSNGTYGANVTLTSTAGLAAFGVGVPVKDGFKTYVITAGALPTTAFVSGTGKQILTTRDVYLVVPCTLNPTAGAAGTVAVELSPDNATYSTLVTITEPAGVALDGTIIPASLQVPAGWYVKLTATNATIGTGTYY